MEQLWIDSRIETRFLLKLFETFEQIAFPLSIETVLCDSSTRTKTLSAAQIHPSSGNYKSRKIFHRNMKLLIKTERKNIPPFGYLAV